jgi:sugar phosphate permease
MFAGSWLSGVVGEHYAIHAADGSVTHNWQMIWAIPAVVSVLLSILFVFLFRDQKSQVEEVAHDVTKL